MRNIAKENRQPAVAPAFYVVATTTSPRVEVLPTEDRSDADAPTLNEITRYTISPDVTSGPGDGDRQRTLNTLFELFHYQELDLLIKTNGTEVERLTAAFDLLRWEELNLAKTVVQKAIVRAGLFLDSDLRTQLSIVHQELDAKWNLILTLLLDCPKEKAEKNLRRAQLVGREVLRALHSDPKNRTRPLSLDELTKPEEEAVQSVAQETIYQSGGHAWRKPLAIVIDDKIELKLEGKMTAKPDPVDYKPTKELLVGKCRGFVNDHKNRAVLFSISDGNCVEIGFTESHVQERKIDLLNVAELNRREAVCRVTTDQTIDPRGKHTFQFVSMEADDPEPDLLTGCLDVNKNSDTATNMTHSNES